MKKIWYALPISALMLSGCSSMMYGSNVAPVINNDVVYGAPIEVHQNQQQASKPKASIKTPANSAQAQVSEVQVSEPSPYSQVGQGQTSNLQNQAVNGQAPVVNQAQQTVTTAQTEAAIAAQAEQQNADGWSIKPQVVDTTNTQQQAVDTANQAIRPATTMVNNTQDEGQQPAEQAQNPTNQAQQTAQTESDNTQQNANANANASQPAQNAGAQGGQSAVDSLLHQASASLGKGDLDGAAAYLEDASRIQPKNAKILYDIANIRYHQGKYQASESAASRAVRVGGSNDMMKKTWSLIANSRKQLGDNQGAITAAEKASSL